MTQQEKVVSMRLGADLYAAYKRIAKREERTLSYVMRRALVVYADTDQRRRRYRGKN